MKQVIKRDKAWLGAVIGAATGIAGSIFGANAQKKAARAQARAQNKQATLEMANNLSNSYGDQEYVDDFQNKVVFKNGGRVKRNKLFSCGGRRRFADGGGLKLWDGANDLNSIINGIGGATSNVVQQNAASNAQRTTIQPVVNTANIAKQSIKKPSYFNADNTQQLVYRCGGYILKHRK